MITPRGLVAFAALIATAAFTWWVLQINAPREVREREARHEPDYHFGAPRITRYGANGLVDLALTASHAVHYPDDNSVVLDALRVELLAPDGTAWIMVADHGTAPMQGDRLALSGNVKITRPADPAQGGEIELTTEHAELDTRVERISSDDPVVMTHGNNRVSATGLLADLRAERITLRSQVRGTYAVR